VTQSAGSSPVKADRLNGWKEIASHLDKSVRTAIRWEKHGLPVHRIHTERGEIVYAFRGEIDRWLIDGGAATETRGPTDVRARPAWTSTSTTPPTRLVGRHLPVVVGCLVALAGLVIGAVMWRGARSAERGAARAAGSGGGLPANWRVEQGRLEVFDSSGLLLWSHDFASPMGEATYDRSHSRWADRVSIEDLDGDGDPEVLAVPVARDATDLRLYCFEANGRMRFTHRPSWPVTFGSLVAQPPFGLWLFRVAAQPAGGKAVWVAATHHVWFPSVVQKLSAQGAVLGEHWMNGHIATIALDTREGRSIVLVGGTSNETGGAALVVLDQRSPSGSVPADDRDYQCVNCPPGRPLAYLVFPRMEIARVSRTRSILGEVRVLPNGHILARAEQGVTVVDVRPDGQPFVFYELDRGFRVVSAEIGDNYATVHTRLAALGLIGHPLGRGDDADLFPVLRWTGDRLERVTEVVGRRESAVVRLSEGSNPRLGARVDRSVGPGDRPAARR
jgi:hypothetical protein